MLFQTSNFKLQTSNFKRALITAAAACFGSILLAAPLPKIEFNESGFTFNHSVNGLVGSVSGKGSHFEKVKVNGVEMTVTFLTNSEGSAVIYHLYSDSNGRPLELISIYGAESKLENNFVLNRESRSVEEIRATIRENLRSDQIQIDGNVRTRFEAITQSRQTQQNRDFAKSDTDREICIVRCDVRKDKAYNSCDAAFEAQTSGCSSITEFNPLSVLNPVTSTSAAFCRSSAISRKQTCRNDASEQWGYCKIICLLEPRPKNPLSQ